MKQLVQLIAALALVCAAVPAAAQDKVRLLLDWFVNPDHAALVIAKQRGLFTKHGLDVEMIAPADPNARPSWWPRVRPTMRSPINQPCRCSPPRGCRWYAWVSLSPSR